jgi:hypothetical protein
LEAITDKKVFVYIIEKSMSKMRRILCSLLSILMLATLAVADGVVPEEAPQQPEVAEKVTKTPAKHPQLPANRVRPLSPRRNLL